MKYPKELIEEKIKDCQSVAELLRKLGIRETGGSHGHISRKIKEYGIDTSHMLRQAHNKGKISTRRMKWPEILKQRISGRRQEASFLRRAMQEYGKVYECVRCNNNGYWNGKPLVLEVHHNNNDWLDDRPENVDFICPNCHSQE